MTRCCSAALAACVLLSSCATKIGPKTVPGARFDYNQAIARSLNEQLLLNLVRLRYRDTPMFVDVGSVIAQYSFSGSASISPTLNVDGTENNSYGLGVGGSYTENPTITYEPLKGADFTRRLLTPIDPVALFLLAESGWSVQRLLMCCVQRVNAIDNAPSATGPTPERVPDNSRFTRLAELLRELQTKGELHLQAFVESNRQGMMFGFAETPADPEDRAIMQEVRGMLGLKEGEQRYELQSHALRTTPDAIAVTARSLLGVFFFLSLAVEPPAEHVEQGLVIDSAGGRRLDWAPLIGKLLRVRSTSGSPPRAFVRVRYRGYWFYIDDADLNSKATFNLLSYLYSLQAATGEGVGPMLTVGVGK